MRPTADGGEEEASRGRANTEAPVTPGADYGDSGCPHLQGNHAWPMSGAPCIAAPATATPKKAPPLAKTAYPGTPGLVGRNEGVDRRACGDCCGSWGGQCIDPYYDLAGGD